MPQSDPARLERFLIWNVAAALSPNEGVDQSIVPRHRDISDQEESLNRRQSGARSSGDRAPLYLTGLCFQFTWVALPTTNPHSVRDCRTALFLLYSGRITSEES